MIETRNSKYFRCPRSVRYDLRQAVEYIITIQNIVVFSKTLGFNLVGID